MANQAKKAEGRRSIKPKEGGAQQKEPKEAAQGDDNEQLY
jgi:hypothetical protein